MYFTAWISEQNTAHRLCLLLEFWPCFLLFSALAHPPAALASHAVCPSWGIPYLWATLLPDFFMASPTQVPHPASSKVTFSEGLIFPLRPAASSPPTPPPCPFSTRLGNVLFVHLLLLSRCLCYTGHSTRWGWGGLFCARNKAGVQ